MPKAIEVEPPASGSARTEPAAKAAPWRDLALFICGPALLMAAAAALFAVHPWTLPYPPQAEGYGPVHFGPVLALGAVGVWLSSRTGLPSAPPLSNGAAWLRLTLPSVLLGLSATGVSFVLDRLGGTVAYTAKVMGVKSLTVAFPASLAHYTFGSVLEECVLRLAPLPILSWLIGELLLRGRHRNKVFWTLAAATSLVEPVAQTAMWASHAPALAATFIGVAFFMGLIWAGLFKRYGWPAPLIVRLVQELTQHLVWPMIAGG